MSIQFFSKQQLESMPKLNSSIISSEDRFSLYRDYSEFSLEYVMYENEAVPMLVHIFPYENSFMVESYCFNSKHIYDSNEGLVSNTLFNYCIGMDNVLWNQMPTNNSEAFTLRKFVNTVKDFMDEKIMEYVFPGFSIRKLRELCDRTKEKDMFGTACLKIGFSRAIIDSDDENERLYIVQTEDLRVMVVNNMPVPEEDSVRYDIIDFIDNSRNRNFKDVMDIIDYPILFDSSQRVVDFEYNPEAKAVELQATPFTIVNKLSYVNFMKAIMQISRVLFIYDARNANEELEEFSNNVSDRIEELKEEIF